MWAIFTFLQNGKKIKRTEQASDKLIGRISGCQGLVLMPKPDGWDGMSANPALCSTPLWDWLLGEEGNAQVYLKNLIVPLPEDMFI